VSKAGLGYSELIDYSARLLVIACLDHPQNKTSERFEVMFSDIP
jgi:hypothetical protein